METNNDACSCISLFSHYYRGKWSKLEDIFITHKSWKNVPGTFDIAARMQSITQKGSHIRIIGMGDVVSRTFCFSLVACNS